MPKKLQLLVPLVGAPGEQGPQGERGATGDNGATFTPSISEDGVLSWTNDKGLTNPKPFTIGTTDTGASGVHVGPDKPTDSNVDIWVDTDEESSEIPSGSSEWEVIASGELTEEATGINITVDNDGNPFALAEARLYLSVNGTETNTADRGYLRFRHNSNTARYGAEVSVGTMIRDTTGTIGCATAMYDYTSNATQTNAYVGSQHAIQTTFCTDQNYEALTAIYILGITDNAKTMGIGTKWALRGVRK